MAVVEWLTIIVAQLFGSECYNFCINIIYIVTPEAVTQMAKKTQYGYNYACVVFKLYPHSNHVTSSKQADTLVCHTTMRRHSINFLYNLGHMTL